MLGLPEEALRAQVLSIFADKGEKVQNINAAALARGYQAAREALPEGPPFPLEPAQGGAAAAPFGNEAIALGAVVAGCRFCAAYPITPASEILELMMSYMAQVGGVAIQAEDEIAAVMATIGAGFAGVRALTATSGPGISLKQEALGLANMAEIPLVVVDVQRGGPSTGMPTKHEQSDLMALTYGTHGDSPRVILAPATAEDAYYDTITAFNLADRLQMPIYIASDLSLGLNKQTVEELTIPANAIDRGDMISSEELATMERRSFHRYEVTESGISRRSIPGQYNGQFTATGLEHDPFGEVSENPRTGPRWWTSGSASCGRCRIWTCPRCATKGPRSLRRSCVGFGSTYGAYPDGPSPAGGPGRCRWGTRTSGSAAPSHRGAGQGAAGARKVIVVENNSTGQLAKLIKLTDLYGHPGGITPDRLESVLKYDGTPFVPEEIVQRVKEVVLLA